MCRIASRASHEMEAPTMGAVAKELEVTALPFRLYVPSTDHNPRHLLHALQRDPSFKQWMKDEILNAEIKLPLAVYYERDVKMFWESCQRHCKDTGTTIFSGDQYVVLLQKSHLFEGDSSEPVNQMTLFRKND